MREEYKKSMKNISLSDQDRARILKNVQDAYRQIEEADQAEKESLSVVSRGGPRFSVRRWGTVAAACLVLAASALLIRDQFGKDNPGMENDMPVSGGAVSAARVVVWEQFDSIDDIEKYTDCKTYTLGNVSKNYEVKRIEVANEERYVRIIYKNKTKKHKDKIVFEYKEGKKSEEIIGQFDPGKELKKEKVDGSVVTMYGNKKCDGMMWEKESCTFGVLMTKPRSVESAKKIISATMDNKVEPAHHTSELKEKDRETEENLNAIGWQDEDEFVTQEQNESILKELMERQGFCVKIKEPAQNVVYKYVDDYESFAFTYDLPGMSENQRIIGYAGWEGCPEGVMDDYEEESTFTVDGIEVYMYTRKKYETDHIYVFSKKEIELTILLNDFDEENSEEMLEMLFEVVHVSKDKDEEEPVATEKPEDKDPVSPATKSAVSEEPQRDTMTDEDDEENHLNSTIVTP